MERFSGQHNRDFPTLVEMAAPTAVHANSAPASWSGVMSTYQPISLPEMDGVSLLKRTDTKFVMPAEVLQCSLAELADDYRVLQVAGTRLNHYHTLYFDTAGFAMYYRHHTGANGRYKIRSRVYLESGVTFFEVKHKNRKGRTVKERLQTPQPVTDLTDLPAAFAQRHSPYLADELRPVLWNSFTRITLVSRQRAERVTLDVDLAYYWAGRRIPLPGVAVAEVKQDSLSLQSDFIDVIRSLGIRQTSFSKYCIGAGLMYPQLKSNHFKPQRLMLARIMEQGNYVNTH